MKKNVGNFDKAVRLVIAAILTVLIFTKIITGVWAVIAIILAAVLLFTSFFSICPLYMMLGINTEKVKKTA